MPEGLRSVLEFISTHRAPLAAAGFALLLIVIAIITLAVGISRGRRLKQAGAAETKEETPKSGEEITPPEEVVPPPRVKRTKLTIGDVASPWTQGVYERHSPEAKINVLLPAFAFDAEGLIHRTRNATLVKDVDFGELLSHCDTAAGVSSYGVYTTLALWHADRPELAVTALKVAGHAMMAAEQRDLIRYLFQDITGVPLLARAVPSLSQYRNAAFAASFRLYSAERIHGKEWKELEPRLEPALREHYDHELARKLPIRHIYRQAASSAVFSDGLFDLNKTCLVRFMNARRWQRLLDSDKRARFQVWVAALPCNTEAEALLHVANPEVFDAEDLTPELRETIPRILNATRAKDWLFGSAKMPSLTLRLHYFKYFCLFKKYNEAVRCFATLSILRKDRATRLYYARALFSSGMQHDAWSEMSALLADYPRDAAVMNETAIYAHQLGRHEEAQEIFALARAMYPDDATLAYNEAVFAEQYSKKQVAEKWSAVQKMTDWSKPQKMAVPPVVE